MNLFHAFKNSSAGRKLRALRLVLYAYRRVIRENLEEIPIQLRYNATFRTLQDRTKLEARLCIGAHVIEKGLSFRHPRKAFGVPRIIELLELCETYERQFGDSAFLDMPLAVVKKYIDCFSAESGSIQEIIEKYELLTAGRNLAEAGRAGVVEVTAAEVSQAVDFDYRKFIRSRHSYRYFLPGKVPAAQLERAFETAQYTPSACNRQAWRVYVFEDQAKRELLELQCGSGGFREELGAAVLVTAEQRCFFLPERNQAYIDGGLYAMNLLNAFHAAGLGTIPLLVSDFDREKRDLLQAKWGIPRSELPILLIGVGQLEPVARVAVSARRSWRECVKFHSR